MHFSEKKEESRPVNQPEETASQGQHFVVREGTAFIHDLMDGSLKLEELTRGANAKELEAVVATAEPGVSCWEGKIYAGGKWYYILEGELEVVVNDDSYILVEGDSIYVECTVPHIWRNPGKKSTKTLVLSSPPTLSVESQPG